jgi:hypothetical protein
MAAFADYAEQVRTGRWSGYPSFVALIVDLNQITPPYWALVRAGHGPDMAEGVSGDARRDSGAPNAVVRSTGGP